MTTETYCDCFYCGGDFLLREMFNTGYSRYSCLKCFEKIAAREIKDGKLDGEELRKFLASGKEAKKYDHEKTRFELVPLECLEAVAEVYTHGAKKYGDNQWQHLPNYEDRYYAALMRHMTAYRKGEERDKESGLLHTAHIAWNAFALLWKDLHND